MKKIPCKSILLALLLLAGVAGAHADPGRGRGGPQQDQAQQRYDGERDTRREMQRNERNADDANARGPSRNSGRMTPEERSALRRQINEAGQDIYSGKYKR